MPTEFYSLVGFFINKKIPSARAKGILKKSVLSPKCVVCEIKFIIINEKKLTTALRQLFRAWLAAQNPSKSPMMRVWGLVAKAHN